MKVLICSDSHGLTDELIQVKQRHEADFYIHCGDSELTADHKALEGYEVVSGNCDFEPNFPNQLVLNAKDRIFVTHGHLYNVKSSLLSLQYQAQEHDANIICYGHSHILGIEKINNLLFINPGSLRLPRMRKEKTYVLLHISEEKWQVEVFELTGEKIFDQVFSKN
ncbi:metallophosphoesterase family protein [Bacillus kwashiorkori]|uniref:metallophosphoesterase family protein n=1 Tax=Bacillus kwashiorkori TaxID=1522318 RepID=UPI0007825262|nr:metallophosphoesterase [Bacillus kwashiorkori]